jgi:hypothetical protein
MAARLGPWVAVLILLAAAGARADTPADIRRGLAAVGPSTSDQAALRAATTRGEASPGYRLGAALGAWRNAATGLDFDLHNPSGDGDDSEAIRIDCFDERVAFARLDAARVALAMTPREVVMAAGGAGSGALEAWREREAAAPSACP